MPTTPKTRPARLRRWRETGELSCDHRGMSVCPECFARTPGLIDVAADVYRYDPRGWDEETRDQLRAGDGSAPYLRLSPGTTP